MIHELASIPPSREKGAQRSSKELYKMKDFIGEREQDKEDTLVRIWLVMARWLPLKNGIGLSGRLPH